MARSRASPPTASTPCVWDCRTARAAELTGFKALMLSGGQLAESVAGLPDIGLITADDLVQSTERICNYSSLPLIVDADDGFGDTPLTTYRLIKRLINTRSPILRVYPVRGRQASKHPGSTCPTLSSSRANATHKEKT